MARTAVAEAVGLSAICQYHKRKMKHGIQGAGFSGITVYRLGG
jgi:hypothetical protein